mmetsp:Transcript_25819/g.40418  ORF Transcript_25819/g.40418 Transcript_25819/m.40418 type:complete len:132 (+) Transcript_25819:1022-1417(+)
MALSRPGSRPLTMSGRTTHDERANMITAALFSEEPGAPVSGVDIREDAESPSMKRGLPDPTERPSNLAPRPKYFLEADAYDAIPEDSESLSAPKVLWDIRIFDPSAPQPLSPLCLSGLGSLPVPRFGWLGG